MTILEININHKTTYTTTANCKYNANRVAAIESSILIPIYEYVIFSGESPLYRPSQMSFQAFAKAKEKRTFMDILFLRSLDRLKLTFAQLIIKLKPMLSCKIAEIAMKRSFLLT